MRQPLTEADASKVVAIYLRKSRKDKELEDNGIDTLERHEKILRDLAEQQGLIIGEVYREVVSGDSIDSRPEMQRLIGDVHNNKWPAVLVVELERLARGDTKDQGIVAEAFKYSETLIVTPSKTYDPNNEFDEEYFEFGLFMSRREYKTIKRRMQAGIKLSVLEGNYLGSIAPYGYDIVTRGRRDRTLEANENAYIVQQIFQWYAHEKVSLCEIARRLTDMKIPSPKGLPYWSVFTVTKVVQNDVYAGKVRHGGNKQVKEYDADTGKLRTVTRKGTDPVIADGKHTALVSMETWQAAQNRRAKNAPIKQGTELQNAFAGLLRCSKCGHVLHYKCSVVNGKKYPQMRHRNDTPPHCDSSSARYGDILDAVANALAEYIEDFKIKLENNTGNEAMLHAKMIEEMEKNHEALKAKRKKLMQYFEDDIYTEEEFLERKKDINEEMILLSARIEAARAETPTPIDYENKIRRFSETMEAIKNPDSSAKEINNLLKEIVCRIDYTRESRNDPFTLDITLV